MALSQASLRFAVLQLTLAGAVGAGLWLSFSGWRLGRIIERVRADFPDVPQISSTDLVRSLASPHGAKPILLDVRSPEEFIFSHLAGAHRLTPGAELNPAELPADHDRSIVVYSSTGEQSAIFARRLRQAGYGGAMTLEGGIVRWANEGWPLTNDRELVTRVHPGNPEIARLLKEARRAALPAAH